jgi:hypothetical protein
MNYNLIFIAVALIAIVYVFFIRRSESPRSCPICECPTCDCSDILKQAYEISAKDQADLVYEREQIRNELNNLKASSLQPEEKTPSVVLPGIGQIETSNLSRKGFLPSDLQSQKTKLKNQNVDKTNPKSLSDLLQGQKSKLKKQVQSVDEVNETLDTNAGLSESQKNLIKNIKERRAVIEEESNEWEPFRNFRSKSFRGIKDSRRRFIY